MRKVIIGLNVFIKQERIKVNYYYYYYFKDFTYF